MLLDCSNDSIDLFMSLTKNARTARFVIEPVLHLPRRILVHRSCKCHRSYILLVLYLPGGCARIEVVNWSLARSFIGSCDHAHRGFAWLVSLLFASRRRSPLIQPSIHWCCPHQVVDISIGVIIPLSTQLDSTTTPTLCTVHQQWWEAISSS